MTGWAYVRPEAAWDDMDATEVVAAEVKEYGRWMNGEVYGYIIEERAKITSTLRNMAGEVLSTDEGDSWIEVDSCWGFIGMEHVESEAKAELAMRAGEVAA